MTSEQNTNVIVQLLIAIEERDAKKVLALFHPDIEFHWPPGLPYSGMFRGREVDAMNKLFSTIWTPLQPTEEARRLDFRILCSSEDGTVIVKYIWKGIDSRGRRFETATLADYRVREGLLVRAQMYYFDLPGMIAFLGGAEPGGHLASEPGL